MNVETYERELLRPAAEKVIKKMRKNLEIESIELIGVDASGPEDVITVDIRFKKHARHAVVERMTLQRSGD